MGIPTCCWPSSMRGAAGKGAETNTIYLSRLKYIPCQHCDDCLKEGKCRYQDDMQQIYAELEKADVVVLASPVQFSGPPAAVKAMIDRCQCLWARKYVLKIAPLSREKKRKGFLISCRRDGNEKHVRTDAGNRQNLVPRPWKLNTRATFFYQKLMKRAPFSNSRKRCRKHLKPDKNWRKDDIMSNKPLTQKHSPRGRKYTFGPYQNPIGQPTRRGNCRGAIPEKAFRQFRYPERNN